jgi:hypothetical protein
MFAEVVSWPLDGDLSSVKKTFAPIDSMLQLRHRQHSSHSIDSHDINEPRIREGTYDNGGGSGWGLVTHLHTRRRYEWRSD